jgi:hypothetical protein
MHRKNKFSLNSPNNALGIDNWGLAKDH